jgi:hypothetical protein
MSSRRNKKIKIHIIREQTLIRARRRTKSQLHRRLRKWKEDATVVETGHKSPECRSKDKIPKDEWAINKARQHAQSSSDAASSSGSTVPSKSKIGEPVVGRAGLATLFLCTNSGHERIDPVG